VSDSTFSSLQFECMYLCNAAHLVEWIQEVREQDDVDVGLETLEVFAARFLRGRSNKELQVCKVNLLR
jgi:hypothetical protein